MKRTRVTGVVIGVLLALAAGAALAQEGAKVTIGGTTYTKWLWGTQRNNGSLYNFTTVPGEGYGDNGQGSEVELLISARLSRQVEVRARLHSRFSQNFWTNFGGFGGRNPAFEDPDNRPPCTGGDCGEFDPRSNQYVKLRGVSVILTPGYRWLDSATIGANDFGMFDPFVIGRIRYIDRDNAYGILMQGSAAGKTVTWDFARISLPRLWAGPNFSTTPGSSGGFHAADAAYGAQVRFAPSGTFDVGVIGEFVNDIEVDPTDTLPDDGRDVRWRFKNTVAGLKFGIHPGPVFDLYGAFYKSWANSNPDFGAPASFGIGGFSPVPAGRLDGEAYKLNADINDPFGIGLSFKIEGFHIGSDYVSMMAARRESDVLLTEGHDSTWSFPGPSNAAFGVFGGNPTRIGYGGWDGNAVQVATINVDNEFTDFDEPMAETAIGWEGVTIAPSFTRGDLEIGGEYTYLTYDTNWQAWGNPTRSLNDTPYPSHEGDTGVGHPFRSAYAPFQDKKTHIAVLRGKTVIPAAKGIDLFGKIKYIKETDDRMNDARFLPFAAGDCPGGGVACANATNFYFGEFSTASVFGNPPVITGAGGVVGYQWKPFDSLSDDDRDLDYWLFSLGAGYQLTNDLYASLAYERYNVDLLDGNTAFQAYNLHEMASGDHRKNRAVLRARYVLAGAEFGFEYQYNWGTFDPDFGGGFVPQVADEDIQETFGFPVGSLGFRGRFTGWNSLEEREFTQQRIKAFMKVQF